MVTSTLSGSDSVDLWPRRGEERVPWSQNERHGSGWGKPGYGTDVSPACSSFKVALEAGDMLAKVDSSDEDNTVLRTWLDCV